MGMISSCVVIRCLFTPTYITKKRKRKKERSKKRKREKEERRLGDS
jgi:hypothetical protein